MKPTIPLLTALLLGPLAALTAGPDSSVRCLKADGTVLRDGAGRAVQLRGGNSWGVYTTIPGKAPPVPNLTTDSADAIRQQWQAWATSTNTFALNPLFKAILEPASMREASP